MATDDNSIDGSPTLTVPRACCAGDSAVRARSPSRRAKWLAFGIAAVLAVVALALGRSGKPEFETPAACTAAYREAILANDVDRYLRCLAIPLQAELLSADRDGVKLSAALARERAAVRSWVESTRSEDGTSAVVQIDGIGVDSNVRSVLNLTRTVSGWKIARIQCVTGPQPYVRFGTHISQVVGR